MELLIEVLGPIIVIVIAVIGGGFFKTYKDQKTLKENNEARDQINEWDRHVEHLEAHMKAEAELRKKMKEKLEKEQGREISDKELEDFFSDRYDDQ